MNEDDKESKLQKLRQRCEELEIDIGFLKRDTERWERLYHDLEKQLRGNQYIVAAFFNNEPQNEVLVFFKRKDAEEEAQILLEKYAYVYIFRIKLDGEYCNIKRAVPKETPSA